MSERKVYSPIQAALGGFLGGPLASAFFIRENFNVLGNQNAVKKTTRFGTLVIAILIVILPFLPDNFPSMAIPTITIGVTKLLIEKLQFKKKDVIDSHVLDFHSNWRVLLVSLICMAIFMLIGVFFIVLMYSLGIKEDV
ncbi:hypothetical protein [Celerinatantimonas sp. YJH-8]|uniref:hypothetical protein n=1 Tax=Celerinatantimonas sp. YJH-8 TaxID=3228714 RepID=UPI0038C4F8DA